MPTLDLLETERLVLRPSLVEDARVFRALWTERDPRVPPHRRISLDGHPTLPELATRIQTKRDAQLLTVVRKSTRDVIGYCGLSDAGNGSAEQPELAYELLRAAHGHGYATEAARAVVAWAESVGCARLWAGVWDWNVASRRVLEKLGFRETGKITAVSAHGRSLLTIREFSSISTSRADLTN